MDKPNEFMTIDAETAKYDTKRYLASAARIKAKPAREVSERRENSFVYIG